MVLAPSYARQYIQHMAYESQRALTYCQSKHKEKRPRPSLETDPPNKFVSTEAVLPVAF